MSGVEVPEGLVILRTDLELLESPWGPMFFTLLGNSTGENNPAGMMYTETHGPATTLYIRWQGGDSYSDLQIAVNLTLSLEFHVSKLPVQLAKLPTSVDRRLDEIGVHMVPAAFDSWRISFSMIEKEIICTSPDGFKDCFRMLKVMRNTIQERLGLNQTAASLIPSYVFKTVLLSEKYTAGHHWEKGDLSQVMDKVLEVILEGVGLEEIGSFFIPCYNLLSSGDHENKLRQCILKEMLNELRGLRKTHSFEDVKEIKKQTDRGVRNDRLAGIRHIQHSGRKRSNHSVEQDICQHIETIPESHKFGHFWNQITDLNSTELDDSTYNFLTGIWSLLRIFFMNLLTSLPVQGELHVLARKFYIRTCEKKKEYEQKHQITSKCTVHQVPLHQLVYETLHDLAECYIGDEGHAFWSSLHKGVSPGCKSSHFFREVAEVTVNRGSEQGFAMFKERMKQYLAFVPEQSLISVSVNYISQIIHFSRDIKKRELDYVKIPEIDLD